MYLVIGKVCAACVGFFCFVWLGTPLMAQKCNQNYANFIISLILSITFGIIIFPGYNEINYEHLIEAKKSNFKYIQRIMDNDEAIPNDVYCLENDTAILKVLENEKLISKLKEEMYEKDLPCIATYYLRQNPDDFEIIPNFVMVNRRYVKPNKFSLTYINSGELLYLFNPQKIGGSNNLYTKYKFEGGNLMCIYSNDGEGAFMYMHVQVSCQIPTIYDDLLKIEDVTLSFSGEIAFCLQDYWKDINAKNGKICSFS